MNESARITITEFLEASIAEDEREALDAPKMSDPYDAHRLAFTDAMRRRVLAECAAKREIVEFYRSAGSGALQGDPARAGMYAGLGEVVLTLAAIYKDHPDYLQEWAW